MHCPLWPWTLAQTTCRRLRWAFGEPVGASPRHHVQLTRWGLARRLGPPARGSGPLWTSISVTAREGGWVASVDKPLSHDPPRPCCLRGRRLSQCPLPTDPQVGTRTRHTPNRRWACWSSQHEVFTPPWPRPLAEGVHPPDGLGPSHRGLFFLLPLPPQPRKFPEVLILASPSLASARGWCPCPVGEAEASRLSQSCVLGVSAGPVHG